MGAFKEPHGGVLKELYLDAAAAQDEKQKALNYMSWDLTDRQLCDIELLLNGAFSPLEGFLTQAEYEGVVKDMRLPGGVLWPMPITLDVSEDFAQQVKVGETIALRDPEGALIATLEVSDNWAPDKAQEARSVFGTEDQAHPGVNYLLNTAHPVYLGGKLRGLEAPAHYDF
jgi:sulfate adenylyltransferase